MPRDRDRQRRPRVVLAILCLLLALGVSPMSARAETWTETFRTANPAGAPLRGYGSVATETVEYRAASGARAWVLRFRCANGEYASTVVGKYLADLDLTAEATAGELAGVPVRTLATGAVVAGCVDGAEARIVTAESAAGFTDFAAAQGKAALVGAVQSAPYPTYLDRFDRYGWGSYGLGGFTNYHSWMTLVDGEKTQKDPNEDLDWLVKGKFRFEPWLDPVSFDNSDGIIKNTESDWMVKRANDAGLPISMRLYGSAGGANWTARRFGKYMEEPADFMMSGWHGVQLYWKAQPHLSWYSPEIHRYLARKAQAKMRPFADNPGVMAWMHPHGELSHDPWYDMHDDYSLRARKHWQGYLQGQGLSLARVSAMFGHADEPFGDWSQVPIPEFATFAGINGQVADLGGEWFWRRERDEADKKDYEFAGIKEEWYKQPLDTATWERVTLPGEDLYKALASGKRSNAYMTTWFRRSFTLTPDQLATTPLYLYAFPISHGGIHSGEFKHYHDVYINGERAGGLGTWGALDVSKLLKAGENEIAVHLFGGVWNGRIFLSTEEPAVFPNLDEPRNALMITWQEWRQDAKYSAWRDILDAMRQVDPNRPIKFMAPIKFGADRWIKLASQYGGWGHFTGEGIWYFPWYKRYGFLYGLPGTSETAGPAKNLNDQFNSFRRTFLAGLNGHDAVFLAQTYSRNPELRAFWEGHAPVLHRMGTYDIDGPQVLIYRSTKSTVGLGLGGPYPEIGDSSRLVQSPWNWDIGRGTLQTLGQSYLYLDDGGLADGKMVGYPLMFDCGNETMPKESVANIAEWVKAGGTYVTYAFSGRNTRTEANTWPIRALTGCEIGTIRKLGVGTVTVGKSQTLLPGFAGKTFSDTGRSMDYIGNNLNEYNVELVPGENSEVIATYENGKAAIVRHSLGRGQVIVLGSMFWRDCEDRLGIWWPEPLETDFIGDLLKGLDFAPAVCTTDDRLVWPQPYRGNAGFSAVTCLVSWHEDQDVTVTTRLRLASKPAVIRSYGVDGAVELPFEWDAANSQAVVKVAMPAKEVKVLSVLTHDPRSSVDYWWNRQQRYWHPLTPSTLDLSEYDRGEWADPTLDLRTDAEFSNDGETWTKANMTVMNAFGADPTKALTLRKRFTVPQDWAATGGRVLLVSGAWVGPAYVGKPRLLLNGDVLHDFGGSDYNEFDVTKALLEGENEIRFEFKGGESEYVGIVGNVYLYHRPAPAHSIPLDGVWKGLGKAGATVSVALPGAGALQLPGRQVEIPAEWAGKYRVHLYVEGSRPSVLGVLVNGTLVRRHHHGFGERGDLDITNALRFGETNTLELYNQYDNEGPKLPKFDIRRVQLDLFKAD